MQGALPFRPYDPAEIMVLKVVVADKNAVLNFHQASVDNHGAEP